jgi:hypothetical protein
MESALSSLHPSKKLHSKDVQLYGEEIQPQWLPLMNNWSRSFRNNIVPVFQLISSWSMSDV